LYSLLNLSNQASEYFPLIKVPIDIGFIFSTNEIEYFATSSLKLLSLINRLNLSFNSEFISTPFSFGYNRISVLDGDISEIHSLSKLD
jgi:hypothetical protein